MNGSPLRSKSKFAAAVVLLVLSIALHSTASSGSRSSARSSSHPSSHTRAHKGSHYHSGRAASSSTGRSHHRSSSRVRSHSGSRQHSGRTASSSIRRDTHGRIRRSAAAKHSFERQHPCPSTGRSSGRCPGYVVDHVRPLECGGADAPSNMQWQTIADGKAKDKTEGSCR